MKIIDESIHFVTLKLKSSIKDLKYLYSRSEGGEESVVQEMSRDLKSMRNYSHSMILSKQA